MPAERIPAVALAGPTASGKTAAAFAIADALAPQLPVEIVSVDSALVYRGMDIGTAKPTREELAHVPHHLIDIRDPLQPYSAARVRAGRHAAHRRDPRARRAAAAGGRHHAVLQGADGWHRTTCRRPTPPCARAWSSRPPPSAGPAMHAELARVDPPTAARLAPGDSQRIQRALEVWHVSGRPLSSFHTTKTGAASAHPISAGSFFSLEPQDRAWLHERIALRFHAMLAAGFLDEVMRLRARGDLHADLPSMRCVGYRQAWESLDGLHPLASLPERGIACHAPARQAADHLAARHAAAPRHRLRRARRHRPAAAGRAPPPGRMSPAGRSEGARTAVRKTEVVQ
ncbi:tRNA delta(2)-isopentenylpyrophosphate transferase [Alicycliphilus sp. B1]|nr:tRNA delta(2)-isopentenylpyrophosphate transferase [Alicycliphilus sp. B1]